MPLHEKIEFFIIKNKNSNIEEWKREEQERMKGTK